MYRGHRKRLRAGVIRKSYLQESHGKGYVQGVCKLVGVICIYEWTKLNGTDSLRVKRRCQLVVRLKTNKCY